MKSLWKLVLCLALVSPLQAYSLRELPREARQINNYKSNFRCPSEGFHADPQNCRIFYRCVGTNNNLTPIQFECGEGTVFDPAITTCNYPYASNREECGGNGIDGGFGNVQSTTTSAYPSWTTQSTLPPWTTQSTQSDATATVSSQIGDKCTQEGFLGDSKNCAKFYRCVSNGQNGYIQHEFNCGPGTVWDPVAVSCNYPWAAQRNDCSEGTTLTESTSGTDGNTQGTGTDSTTPGAGTTSGTDGTPSGTGTTGGTDGTTPGGESTTTDLTPSTTAPCPIGQLEGDQIALVCPTGFKRHPKYCNLFYQCTENTHKILVLSCPEGTIYDDKKIQCLPQNETSPCNGQIAQSSFYKRLNDNSLPPIPVNSRQTLCPSVGFHETDGAVCATTFVKCQRSYPYGRMEGYMYQCPQGYVYWQISKQCERPSRLQHCSGYDIRDTRWEIPVETTNVSLRRRKSASFLDTIL